MASVQPIIERLIFLNKKYELIEKQVRKENLDEKIQEKDIGLEPKLDSYRVFHGRGQLFPGLEFICVDYFQPVLLLTCFSEPPDLWLEDFLLQAKPLFSSMITAVLLQNRYEQKSPIRAIWGELPTGVLARRGQLTFCLQLGEQQNNGFFLDMEPGRQWIEQAAPGKRILNLFAYTCAFSVVAIAAGAQKVVNLDMSSRALEMGRDNHRQNHLDKRCSEFLAENILKSWGRIKRRGPYDIVIIDRSSCGDCACKPDFTCSSTKCCKSNTGATEPSPRIVAPIIPGTTGVNEVKGFITISRLALTLSTNTPTCWPGKVSTTNKAWASSTFCATGLGNRANCTR